MKFTVKYAFRAAYRKPSKKFIAQKFYEKYNYLRNVLDKIRMQGSNIHQQMRTPVTVKTTEPEEAPKREELIANCMKYKRFKSGGIWRYTRKITLR